MHLQELYLEVGNGKYSAMMVVNLIYKKEEETVAEHPKKVIIKNNDTDNSNAHRHFSVLILQDYDNYNDEHWFHFLLWYILQSHHLELDYNSSLSYGKGKSLMMSSIQRNIQILYLRV